MFKGRLARRTYRFVAFSMIVPVNWAQIFYRIGVPESASVGPTRSCACWDRYCSASGKRHHCRMLPNLALSLLRALPFSSNSLSPIAVQAHKSRHPMQAWRGWWSSCASRRLCHEEHHSSSVDAKLLRQQFCLDSCIVLVNRQFSRFTKWETETYVEVALSAPELASPICCRGLALQIRSSQELASLPSI